jgi:hypothetical protein
MPIPRLYWLESSAPALQGLTPEQIKAAKRRVRDDVLRHWQVWAPFVLFFGALAWFVMHGEAFAHHQNVPIVAMTLLGNLLTPPYHHYLQYHLTQGVVSR